MWSRFAAPLHVPSESVQVTTIPISPSLLGKLLKDTSHHDLSPPPSPHLSSAKEEEVIPGGVIFATKWSVMPTFFGFGYAVALLTPLRVDDGQAKHINGAAPCDL